MVLFNKNPKRETENVTAKTERRSGRRKEPAGPDVFTPPLTVSHPALLDPTGDSAFRQTLYMMVTSFGRLQTCRDAFGRSVDLTGSQFTVLIGAAYTQGENGVTIRQLADHVQLAATHVTTEVGRMCRLGLLKKRVNALDRRSVLVQLTAKGEQRLIELSPFVRAVNDLLFSGIGRQQFRELDAFLTRFVDNTELALEEIRRREKAPEA
ncbi:MAG: MarR family transcriptional regulator [Hyphomicrobiales bacterium]|nr:MarR family transcriptional regulator [Hyphomicrobiales bacterium]